MSTQAETAASSLSRENPEPEPEFHELPDVYENGVFIPHSFEYYDRLEAHHRRTAPQQNEQPDEYDEEEVSEFEQPNSSNSYLSASPLDRQFEQTNTPSGRDRDYAAQVAAAHQAPRCRHVKASGIRCKAPALRGCDYCYFHKRIHLGPRLIYPTLTQLEDAHGIQNAIMEVLTGILELRIDSKTAGRLLYGLQTAASNLKRLSDIDPNDIVTEEPPPDRKQDGTFRPEDDFRPREEDPTLQDQEPTPVVRTAASTPPATSAPAWRQVPRVQPTDARDDSIFNYVDRGDDDDLCDPAGETLRRRSGQTPAPHSIPRLPDCPIPRSADSLVNST